MLDLDWDQLLSEYDGDVNKQWETIKTKIEDAVQAHIPSYQTTEKDLWKKGKVPLKPSTRREIRKKHRCWQRAYETKQEVTTIRWKQQRNKVKKLIKEAEQKYENDIAEESKLNPKKLWKYIRSKTRVNTVISPLVRG